MPTPRSVEVIRMARKSRTAPERRHAVYAKLNVPELTKAGSSLFLYVYASNEKIGELEIGRGALYWRGGGRKRWKRIPWTRFAEIMDGLAYDE
jgi:hypothetical protein